MNAYLLGQQVPEVWNFGLFTIAKVGYQAQVIPALLAGLALGFIETRLKRIVPDYLYLVIVPVCSLILAVFLAHAIIGPFGPPDRRRRGLRGTPSVNRQLRADRRRAVRLPLRAAGDYRCPPDHPRYRYADDPEHGRHPGVAADCAVEYCPGVGGGWHHQSPAASRMNVKSRYRRRSPPISGSPSQRCTVST